MVCSTLLFIRAVDPVNSLGLLPWDALDFLSFNTASTILTMTAVFFYVTIKFWFGMRQRTIPHEAAMRILFSMVSVMMYVVTLVSLLIRFRTRDPMYVSSIFTIWSLCSFVTLISWVNFFALRLWLAVRHLSASKQEVRRISQEHDMRMKQQKQQQQEQHTATPITVVDTASSTLPPYTAQSGRTDSGPPDTVIGTVELSQSQRVHSGSVGQASDDGTGTGDEPSGAHHSSSATRKAHPHRAAEPSHSHNTRKRHHSADSAVNRSMRKLFIMLAVCNTLLCAGIVAAVFIVRNSVDQSGTETFKTFVWRQWAFMWAHMSCTYVCVWYAWQPHAWSVITGSMQYRMHATPAVAQSPTGTSHSHSHQAQRAAIQANGRPRSPSAESAGAAAVGGGGSGVDERDGDPDHTDYHTMSDSRPEYDQSVSRENVDAAV